MGHGSFATKCGRRRRYRCTVCGGTVSTNTGTAYSGLRCTRRDFDQVASLRVEGVSISPTARVTGHSRNTIARWLERASTAAKRFERLFGSACVYGQVLKTRRNDRVVRVERRGRIGTAGRLQTAVWESEDSETLNTSFVKRLNLTIRQGSAYLRRRSRCHARGADQLRGHVDLLRCYYNFIRPHRALKFGRETRTPAMQAGLVNAPMDWSDIFTAPAALYAFLVAVIRVPVTVQLQTSSAALSTFSWPHEHRSAA